MKEISLSTSLCPLATTPKEMFSHWQRFTLGKIIGLSLDPRLPPPLQEAFFSYAQREGYPCSEVSHPFMSSQGRRIASAISEDRDERKMAKEQILSTLERARQFSAQQILLYPFSLKLQQSPATIKYRFLLDNQLGIDQLTEERSLFAVKAFDRLCQVFDPVLQMAERFGISLSIPVPSPWPHHIPNEDEVFLLGKTFSGALLGRYYFLDWAYLNGTIQGSYSSPAMEGASAIRITDACGLTSGLPIGSGEISREWLVSAAKAKAPHLFAFNSDIQLSEVEHSLMTFAEWTRKREE